jgi:hypothetical protein
MVKLVGSELVNFNFDLVKYIMLGCEIGGK